MTVRVAICNERFLTRFGVDRILFILGRALADDFLVSFYYVRGDEQKLEAVTSRLHRFELGTAVGIDGAEAEVVRQCERIWQLDRPDVVVSGGWPFFAVAPLAAQHGIKSIFIDAGAVPHDFLTPEIVSSQLALRRVRQTTLSFFDYVLPISRFIETTQSIPDRGTALGVHTVLLGADHLTPDPPGDDRRSAPSIASVLKARSAGLKFDFPEIMLLGRFEEHNYKNSGQIYDIIRRIVPANGKLAVYVLSGEVPISVPSDVAPFLVLLHTLSDEELDTIMERCSFGLSLSLWEGFNLPLVEMQRHRKPVLAYNVGAHPEVIAHPWCLCDSLDEMAHKAKSLLAAGPPAWLDQSCYDRTIRDFRWEATLRQWKEFITRAPRTMSTAAPRRMVFMDVTNAARDPANSGVIRVCRRLSATLQALGTFDLVFIQWDPARRTYAGLGADNVRCLSTNAGPSDGLAAIAALRPTVDVLDRVLGQATQIGSAPPLLLIPEVVLDGSMGARVTWAERRDMLSACIFYDMIPINNSELVSSAVARSFPAYVDACLRCDALISISASTQAALERYISEHALATSSARDAVWLPSQFSDYPRQSVTSGHRAGLRILCVATLEPRKNHLSLLKAFREVRLRRPNDVLRLTLVGNAYEGGHQLVEKIQEYIGQDGNIVWTGVLSDAELGAAYADADLTIYPSLVEGFGMPILESLWMGKPCVCHNAGVMAELAEGGGCLTVDMRDSATLSTVIAKLLDEPDRLAEMARRAGERRLSDWADYGLAISRLLYNLR